MPINPNEDQSSTFLDIGRKLAESFRPLSECAARVNVACQLFAPRIRQALWEINEHIQTLPGRSRNAVIAAAQQGWYISDNMTLADVLEIPTMNERDLNESMMEFWRSHLSAVEARLVDRYPNRRSILVKAMKAHARGDYELSIPLFLIQADGICYGITNIQLYSRGARPGELKLTKYVEGLDTFDACFLESLRLVAPLSWNEKERDGKVNILNRHAILHGEDTAYATEVNGLKAVSLLSFVDWSLQHNENQGQDPN